MTNLLVRASIKTLRELYTTLDKNPTYNQVEIKNRTLIIDGFLFDCFWCDVDKDDDTSIVFTINKRERFINHLEKAIEDNEPHAQDAINPTHYNGTQSLDRMVSVFGVDAVINFCEINAFKYRMRAGKKENNPIEQDIKKALWYEGKAKELKRNDNE